MAITIVYGLMTKISVYYYNHLSEILAQLINFEILYAGEIFKTFRARFTFSNLSGY